MRWKIPYFRTEVMYLRVRYASRGENQVNKVGVTCHINSRAAMLRI